MEKLRWERMKEVFKIIENNGNITVRELSDILDIDIQLSDNLLRHYNRNGYLTRQKNFLDKYVYSLSDKGINQLRNFLESGKYLRYVDITLY